MKLNTYERLLLINNLPKTGSFTNLRIVRELLESLSFSEEEHKALGFDQDEKGLSWNMEADREVEIEIGDVARKFVLSSLLDLSEKEQANMELLAIWEKFGFTED